MPDRVDDSPDRVCAALGISTGFDSFSSSPEHFRTLGEGYEDFRRVWMVEHSLHHGIECGPGLIREHRFPRFHVSGGRVTVFREQVFEE
jgi:hypothetical protein